MSHTPTPWIGVPQSNGAMMIARQYETGRQVNPKGLRIIGFTMARGNSLKEDEANAQFILRAVNSYADLLRVAEDFDEALKELRMYCECGAPDCRTTRLRSVLEKAKT